MKRLRQFECPTCHARIRCIPTHPPTCTHANKSARKPAVMIETEEAG